MLRTRALDLSVSLCDSGREPGINLGVSFEVCQDLFVVSCVHSKAIYCHVVKFRLVVAARLYNNWAIINIKGADLNELGKDCNMEMSKKINKAESNKAIGRELESTVSYFSATC